MQIHDIDKRLAVLEALARQHMEQTNGELAEIKKLVTGVQVRVFGMAAAISIIIGVGGLWLRF